MNIVRTLTEHLEPEHLVQVRVHHLLEPNINVQMTRTLRAEQWPTPQVPRGEEVSRTP